VNEHIPEFIDEQSAPLPVTARPVTWLTAVPALLALPFAPRRIGAHLSRSSWRLTLCVHIASLLAMLLLIGFADALWQERHGGLSGLPAAHALGGVVSPPQQHLEPAEALQWFITSSINMLYIRTNGYGDIYALLGVLVAAHLACWMLAVLAMPFIAAGEAWRRLFTRALKLSLWSSIVLVAAAGAVVAIAYARELLSAMLEYGPLDFITFCLCSVGVWWWFSLLVRLGSRYAGLAEGPGWTPRRPRCARCGYVLTGLSRQGRCPECSLSVQESLTRAAPHRAWEAAHWYARPGVWAQTVFAMIAGKETRAAPKSAAAARRLLWWNCGFVAACFGLLLAYFALGESERAESLFTRYGYPLVVLLGCYCAVKLVLIASISAFTLITGWRPRGDPRAPVAAIGYASAALLVPLLTALLTFAIYVELEQRGWTSGGVRLPILGTVDKSVLWMLALIPLPLLAFVWAIARLARAARRARPRSHV
jgi:hypothetical protein